MIERAGQPNRVAVVYSPEPGSGGSGLLARQVLAGMTMHGGVVHALGPRPADGWSSPGIAWYDPPPTVSALAIRTWLRWRLGEQVLRHSRARGAWATDRLGTIDPALCYSFTEVALEPLRWAASRGVATVLDSPTGHIRHFRDVVQSESERWCGRSSPDHPTAAMVERVEEEYALAHRIRGGSRFVRDTMVERGIAPDKIDVVPYGIDVRRFAPAAEGRPRLPATGPLRVCFVGMLALHKGFVYLLRAARLLGPSAVSLRLVGGTVDRGMRRLLDEQRRGLSVVAGPAAELLPELHRSELLVLPTLHDGFGFVAAEAMAAGLPVIVTDQCGAADWVRPGESGWVVRAGDENALAAALSEAIDRRAELPAMGRAARETAVGFGSSDQRLHDWTFAAGATV